MALVHTIKLFGTGLWIVMLLRFLQKVVRGLHHNLGCLGGPIFVTLNEDSFDVTNFSCIAFGVCCAQVVLYMHVELMCCFYDCRCGSKK